MKLTERDLQLAGCKPLKEETDGSNSYRDEKTDNRIADAISEWSLGDVIDSLIDYIFANEDAYNEWREGFDELDAEESDFSRNNNEIN